MLLLNSGRVFGRNPIFLMDSATNSLDLIAAEVFIPNAETGHVANGCSACVPISRDLRRVFLVENGVENRLFGQAGWPGAIAALPHKGEFSYPGWSVQNNRFFVVAVVRFTPHA